MGTYLNGIFSEEVPGTAGNWEVENVFPNLTFVDPVQFLEFPGRDKFLVAGKSGKLWLVDNDPATTTKQVLLDIEQQVAVSEDAGLLGVIFHPEFGNAGSPNQGYIYIYYRYTPNKYYAGQEAYVRLSRFYLPLNSNTIDPSTEFILIQQYDRHPWHNGGSMFFGPQGFLHLTMGDEGGANDQYNTTQRIDKWLMGGIFRIDVDRDPTKSHPIRRQPQNTATPPAGWPNSFSQGYYIPNNNPWQDPNGGILEEFYALGLRSPHRMSYDPPTGDIWVGDVGQGSREEVSVARMGDNMQWPYREGNINGPKAKPTNLIGTDKPAIHDYGRGVGNCVIGGLMYRGDKFPELVGKYIFGDHGTRNVWTLSPNSERTNATKEFIINVPAEGVGGKSGISDFETDSQGNIYILKLYGTNLDGGKIYKLKGKNTSPEPPQFLSQTGAFTDLTSLTPASGIIPYDVNAPLWTDGSEKKRWIAIPNDGTYNTPDEQIYFRANSDWDFPEGTVTIKHFELPVDERNPNITKRVETRFFVIGKDGENYGFTYKWNDAGTDAELLTTGDSKPFTITKQDGSTFQQIWNYPSRTQCLTCHNDNAGDALGIKTYQQNGDFTYPSSGITANQLETWNNLGIFHTDIGSSDQYLRAYHIADTTQPLEIRIRSYLDGNCSMCHRPGGVQGAFDARFTTPLPSQNIINANNISNASTIDGKIVLPGDPEKSELYIRDKSLGNNAMPPLGKSVVDQTYIDALESWISSLDPSSNDCDQIVLTNNQLGIHDADSEELLYKRYAFKAIDGDPTTFWHTPWSSGTTSYPHYIQIDLGDPKDVIGLKYLPRQDASFNGTIKEYEIYTSADGVNWGNPITSGEFAATKDIQDVYFVPANARFVMLKGLNEINGNPWASAAEIEIVTQECINCVDPTITFLSDITPGSATNGLGPIEYDSSVGGELAGDGSILTINNDTYAKGIGVQANSNITYQLDGSYGVFLTDIGVDASSCNSSSVVFEVYTDGILAFQSPEMSVTDPAVSIEIDIEGINELQLIVNDIQNENSCMKANWAGAKIQTCTNSDNLPPTSEIIAQPKSGLAPLEVSFDGTTSADPENGSLSYQWDLGNGFSSTQPTYNHVYNTPGKYEVTLIISDNRGSTDTSTIVIDAFAIPDTIAPSIPANFVATEITHNSVTFTWDQSQDDSTGIAGYFMYQSGFDDPIDTVTQTTATIIGLDPNTIYYFAVSSVDSSGNISDQTTALQVITSLAPCGDTTFVKAGICEGESYLFGGEEFTTSGEYVSHFESSSGCDSVVLVDLVVNYPKFVEYDIQICADDSYLFGSNILTETGIYVDSLVSETGCDSIVTLNLTVNTVYLDTVYSAIKDGENYNFGGVLIDQPGTYYDTLTSENVCDTIITLVLSEKLEEFSIVNAEICEGNKYEFGGNFLTEPGTYIDTLVSSVGTDSIVSLTLSVYPEPEIVIEGYECGENQNLYSLTIINDNNYEVSINKPVIVLGNTFHGIPSGESVTLFITDPNTGCQSEIIFNGPDCNCSQSESVYLSDLQEVSVVNGYGDLAKDLSNGEDAPITIGGKVYSKGLGAHANSEIIYDLNGAYNTFSADIGVDDGTCDVASVRFTVYTDGEIAYQSPILRQEDEAVSIEVDIQGVNELRLVADIGGDYNFCDHANWADAMVSKACVSVANQLPHARIELFEINGLNVDLFGGESTDADGTIVSHVWDMGDGNTITGENINHTYTNEGEYDITLTVTDNLGGVDTETRTVSVEKIPDTETPGVPDNLRIIALDSKSASVIWDESTDNIGVVGYDVYLDGNFYATVAIPSVDITGLAPGSTHTVTVAAFDASENKSGVSSPLEFTTSTCSPETVYLSDLTEVSSSNGFGPIEKDNANGNGALGDGGPITIEGQTYTKGLGVHAPSEVVYNINGEYDTFLAEIGTDDGTCDISTVVFEVYGDGQRIYQSPVIRQTDAPRSIEVDIEGVNQLRLVVTNSGDNNYCDHANWADARVMTTCTVPNALPKAVIDLISTNDYQVELGGGASSDADGTIVEYNWNFGDGNTGTGTTATHTYAGAGTYTIELSVTDDRGGKDIATYQLTLDPIPDDESPTTPSNLRVVSITDQSATVSWDASTDNIGVVGYDVYLDGNFYATVATPSVDITGLAPGSTHTVTVAAFDAAENTSLLSDPLNITTNNCTPEQVFLSDIQEVSVQNGYGALAKDMSNGNDGPITIGGTVYQKGLGAHVYSEIIYDLNGEYDKFLSDIGADDGTCDVSSIVFEVYTDGVLAYQSPILEQGDDPLSIEVDVAGVNELRLVANDAGDFDFCDHANWADARVVTSCEIIIPQSISSSDNNAETIQTMEWDAHTPVSDLSKPLKGTWEIQAYPNPFTNNFTIEWGQSEGDATITISDITGKIVYRTTQSDYNGGLYIDGSRWPKGVYLINIQTGNDSHLKRIVKAN